MIHQEESLDRAALEGEIARLRKVNAALVERAESPVDEQRTDFGIFHSTVLLEDQIRTRTRALDRALRQLEDANVELGRSRAELQAIFDVVPSPLAVSLAHDGTFIAVSHSFAELFGVAPEAMVGRRPDADDLGLWPDDDARTRFLVALDAGDGRVTGFPLDLASADGGVVHLAVSARLLEVGRRHLLLTELHDVTQVTRDARRLRNLAEHDALTRLPNRRLLMERLGQAVTDAARDGHSVAVCYVDLDGFKSVNDRSGHPVGDAVLVELAQRLASVVRDVDTVGRVGGDEFAMVLVDVDGAQECEAVLQRALDTMVGPLVTPGYAGTISTSIGYTIFPDDDASPEQLLSHADRALLVAKRSGKNCFVRYT